jgi:hypothetical protein
MQENENAVEPQYEAPAIEAVMTAEDMEREVAYAGDGGPSIPKCDSETKGGCPT